MCQQETLALQQITRTCRATLPRPPARSRVRRRRPRARDSCGVSLPAISSFGDFRTPAAGAGGMVACSRHPKIFTNSALKGDPLKCPSYPRQRTSRGHPGNRLEGKDFITAVDVSWNQAWNGMELRRRYSLKGERLSLETAPQPSPNDPSKTAVATLLWEREK
jgi:hypothetical protein